MTYASWAFNAYGKDEGSDLSRLETWNRIKESTGKDTGEEKPVIQQDIIYLWNSYMDIKSCCETLSILELDAYQRVNGTDFSPWEASIMFELERLRKSNG